MGDDDADHFSYAVSATAALPFIKRSERDALLAVAFDHPSADVQMEGAWAAAKLGREAGINWLARMALDVNRADRAKQYLRELGRGDSIPVEAEAADFKAKAEFAQWLAHPSELGRPPDEVEVIDHRVLNWPPNREPVPLWLIRYRLKDESGLREDDVGVGLVGSVTFCLFSYKLEQRPPQDAYAIHCYWEMECRNLISEINVSDDSTEYEGIFRQYESDVFAQKQLLLIVELSQQLEYPQRVLGLAKATREGEPGWIVLDGPRSRWYGASEMPLDTADKLVVMVHVGRVLLEFENEPDRRAFLRPLPPGRTSEEIIAAYERLLDQARSSPKKAKKLLDSFSPLGGQFDEYVDALIQANRCADVPAVIETFRPYWEHNAGYCQLGMAAFRGGHDRIAESFISKLRASYHDWFRSETINVLADIWCRQGRMDEARGLLIEAMEGLLAQSRTATGVDRKLFEERFQDRRSTFTRLFADTTDEDLAKHGIPKSTLTGP